MSKCCASIAETASRLSGSGIEISGGNVTFITPAQVGYKASKVDRGSGGGEAKSRVHLMQSEISDSLLYTTQFQLLDAKNKPRAKVEYFAMFENGDIQEGLTNAEGKTQRFQTEQPEEISVHFNADLLSGIEIIKIGS